MAHKAEGILVKGWLQTWRYNGIGHKYARIRSQTQNAFFKLGKVRLGNVRCELVSI